MDDHYIEWLYGTRFFAETSGRTVPERVLPAEIPTGVCAYRFFTRSRVELDGETLLGAKRDWTPWHYFGTEYTAEDIKREQGEHSILYSNIAGNGYQRAVHTCTGNWYPLNDDETVGEKP